MESNEPAHLEVSLYLVVFGILTLLVTVLSVFNGLNCCRKRKRHRNEPKEYPLESVRMDSNKKQKEYLLTEETDGEHEFGTRTTQGSQCEDEAFSPRSSSGDTEHEKKKQDEMKSKQVEWKKQKQEEKLRREEEERQKLEERLRREEEERQKLEERVRRQEEERQKLEERVRREEEERQKLEEKLRREEEERQKLEERVRREEKERQKQEERLEREEEERQKLEENLRTEEEERQKLEEKLRREEEERQKLEEKLRREEEERQKQKEKLRREEKERQKQEEKLRQEEKERQKLEEKLRREEEERQKLEEKLRREEKERQKLEEKLGRTEVQKPKGNIGLRNQGATCYLNSVLQTLFMTEDFRNTVERLFKPIDVHIAQLFMDLKSGKRNVATTERITPELEINVYEQQDAAEYFQKIMNMVNPEMAKVYQGVFEHKTMCKNPGKEHPLVTRHEPFYIIPICMETYGTDSPINMQSCFDSYFEPIKTCEEDQVKCPTCKEMVNTEIKCDIHKLPPVLVVQLERFQLDYYTMRYKKNKSTVEIQFQLSVKDDSGAQHQYDLYAVVKHIGSFVGGHYYAVIKSFEDHQWYEFNDSSVRKLQFPTNVII